MKLHTTGKIGIKHIIYNVTTKTKNFLQNWDSKNGQKCGADIRVRGPAL